MRCSISLYNHSTAQQTCRWTFREIATVECQQELFAVGVTGQWTALLNNFCPSFMTFQTLCMLCWYCWTHVLCILLLKYRKYSMYFEKSILNTFTHVFQNTILNTFESQYFKKYFKYFSHSIFPNTAFKHKQFSVIIIIIFLSVQNLFVSYHDIS